MSAPNGCEPQLRINERVDRDGALRLAVAGELDLAVIDVLHVRLVALKQHGHRVRLDLAELEFIDSTVLRELLLAVAHPEGTVGTSRSSRTSANPSAA
jgi:anti-anti-sigma regulatory factor